MVESSLPRHWVIFAQSEIGSCYSCASCVRLAPRYLSYGSTYCPVWETVENEASAFRHQRYLYIRTNDARNRHTARLQALRRSPPLAFRGIPFWDYEDRVVVGTEDLQQHIVYLHQPTLIATSAPGLSTLGFLEASRTLVFRETIIARKASSPPG